MKVLVLGASGFIGLPTALAFARAGHIVYGTTRDQKAARQLAKHEIVPLICPANGAHGYAVWGKIIGDIDVVIDTIRSMDAEQPLGALRAVEALADRGTPGTRITYIYTGTSWSHSRGLGGLETWSSEQNPSSAAYENDAWRRDVEAAVLGSNNVNGIVIRPGVLYGRSGSMLEPFLLAPAHSAANAGGVFEVIGLPETRLLSVHQDDLADLYVRAAERGPILKGIALVGANPQSERWTDILDAVVRVSGAKGYKLRAPSDQMPIEVAWSSTTQLRPTLSQSLTGWQPKKPSLVDGVDLYWSAFCAHYEGKKTIPAWALPGVQPDFGNKV